MNLKPKSSNEKIVKLIRKKFFKNNFKTNKIGLIQNIHKYNIQTFLFQNDTKTQGLAFYLKYNMMKRRPEIYLNKSNRLEENIFSVTIALAYLIIVCKWKPKRFLRSNEIEFKKFKMKKANLYDGHIAEITKEILIPNNIKLIELGLANKERSQFIDIISKNYCVTKRIAKERLEKLGYLK